MSRARSWQERFLRPPVQRFRPSCGATEPGDPTTRNDHKKTVTEREDLQIFVSTNDGVAGTTIYEPQFVGDVGLECDLVAAGDQSLSSNRWRELSWMSRSHEEDRGLARRSYPWRQAPARAAAVRAARVAAAMRAR